MLDKVIELIRAEVNGFIGGKLGDTTSIDRVVLTSFVDDTGRVAIPENTVGLSLLNIEEEKTFKTAGLVLKHKSEQQSEFVKPPVTIILQLMFTAYFTNYAESLKHISFILACIQNKRIFDQENTPELQNLDIPKLVFELNTLPLQEQHYIWSMIGLRYLPSIVYKVRMLMVFGEDVASVENVRTIGTALERKEVND